MKTTRFALHSKGWKLDVKHYVDERTRDPRQLPIAIIPGYCMNTYILAYHPRGRPLVEHLTSHGYEVFTANLRGQGDSTRTNGETRIGLKELALVDLPAFLRFVLKETQRERVHMIGCSLGGAMAYAYLAHHPRDHPLASLIGMGAPLRMGHAHPLVRVAFSSARLASLVKLRGTRRLARMALPIARRIPKVLDMYMNKSQIALDRADELVQTVDDPIPHLNVQLTRWIQTGRLEVDGLDVEQGLAAVDLPVLNVFGNADGIVPPDAARAVGDVLRDVEHIEVGDAQHWFAHADMFISDDCERLVFDPIVEWLKRRFGS